MCYGAASESVGRFKVRMRNEFGGGEFLPHESLKNKEMMVDRFGPILFLKSESKCVGNQHIYVIVLDSRPS